MLFRSRQKKSLWRFLRGWLWPRKGLERPWIYLRHRIIRLPDTPHRIAAGVASGVAASLTPFIGLHFIMAGLIAWLVRGNIIASAIGTAVGNPWTFPFIWLGTYKLGVLFLGMRARPDPFIGFSWDMLWHQPMALFGPVMGPMTLGALPLAFVSWWLTYWLLKRGIAFYRARRGERRMRRQGGGAATPA
ncbi:MAG: DUF2062 domain-containing protein [Pseudomonadota bacterium]